MAVNVAIFFLALLLGRYGHMSKPCGHWAKCMFLEVAYILIVLHPPSFLSSETQMVLFWATD